jgi:ABC-type antimicrobial peptide transport system permease subunit
VGVYGVMSYAVRERSRELGVRTALGASRPQILSLVLRQGMRTSLIGAGVGFLGALGAARLLSGFMPGVDAIEPTVFAGVAAVLVAAALTACYLPARRATKIDPALMLRCE